LPSSSSSSSSKSSSSLEALRQQRLKREQEERRRADELLVEHGVRPASDAQEASSSGGRTSRYNSMYHPELARSNSGSGREPKKKERYSDRYRPY
jgi:hypothetical protein